MLFIKIVAKGSVGLLYFVPACACFHPLKHVWGVGGLGVGGGGGWGWRGDGPCSEVQGPVGPVQ